MVELIAGNGGRPIYNDDLEILQQTLFTLEKSFSSFQSQGFVLSGCEILSNNPVENQISEGLVCIGGKILKLDNAVYSTAVPYFIIADTVVLTDERTYENGTSQNAQRIYKAIISTTNNNGIALPANPNTQLLTIWELIKNRSEEIGSIKIISKNAFLAFFDFNTGLGFGKWLGWAWCDGNNGTENLAGRFVYGFKTLDPPIGNGFLGFDGGEAEVKLTKPQTPLPDHNHEMKGIFLPSQGNFLQGTNIQTWKALVEGDKNTENSIDNRLIESHNNLPPYRWLPYIQKIS
jgi:hypothetical protein